MLQRGRLAAVLLILLLSASARAAELVAPDGSAAGLGFHDRTAGARLHRWSLADDIVRGECIFAATGVLLLPMLLERVPPKRRIGPAGDDALALAALVGCGATSILLVGSAALGWSAVGEIGLGGEVRRVSRLDVRVAEAARLGFKRLLVPAVCYEEQKSRAKGRKKGAEPVCELVPIQEVAQAVDWLRENGMG